MRQAADNGDNIAQYTLANYYASGIGVQEDEREANRYLEVSKDYFPSKIMYHILLWKDLMKKNCKPTFRDYPLMFIPSLKEGMKEGQKGLWTLLLWNEKSKVASEGKCSFGFINDEQILLTYELAQMYELVYAIQGSVDSQLEREIVKGIRNLPDGHEFKQMLQWLMCGEEKEYEYIRVQEEDLKKAVELYREAAATGLKKAMRALGHCYEQGIGVDKDLEQAITWYQKAVYAGDLEAMCALGDFYRQNASDFGDMMDADTAKQKAIEWYLKAYKKGVVYAWLPLNDLGISTPL
jgi:TPR repeat protein